jgi:hypothetical protein
MGGTPRGEISSLSAHPAGSDSEDRIEKYALAVATRSANLSLPSGRTVPTRQAAVLHASGKVQVNGAGSRETIVLFSGDSIRTDEDSVANITAGGSSVLVMPNASIKFLGKMVELGEGSVSIATSEGMSAVAGGVIVTPAAGKISKFAVAENEGSVVIAACQDSVTVSDRQQTTTVPEGQETKRKNEESGRCRARS